MHHFILRLIPFCVNNRDSWKAVPANTLIYLYVTYLRAKSEYHQFKSRLWYENNYPYDTTKS
tara:strand:- start:11 stop:196 length:186 start_codon:yes stop_codon:yes gene_type:complete